MALHLPYGANRAALLALVAQRIVLLFQISDYRVKLREFLVNLQHFSLPRLSRVAHRSIAETSSDFQYGVKESRLITRRPCTLNDLLNVTPIRVVNRQV
jgi:hypothetical protein